MCALLATGYCACVGVLGAGLGGGNGRYQGFYGLIGDNFVTLNVVLANGTAITVSESSNPDLLWVRKGAGHNFGIVTSV
jgi:FAD/FMN-containing dehydrogenase